MAQRVQLLLTTIIIHVDHYYEQLVIIIDSDMIHD